MQTRFDGYTATMHGARPENLMSMMWSPEHRVKTRKGHNGFADCVALVAPSGSEFAAVSWGGTQGDLIMLEVKGESTPKIVGQLRSSYEHRCTRVDSCHDIDTPGAFQKLLDPCLQVKKGHKLKGSKAGDWDDFPEDGRTLYIGARTSPVRLRLYEKGHQPEYRHLNRPDWVRMELQVRPVKAAKDAYSTADSLEVWGASRWSRELAGLVLASNLPPLPAGTAYRLSDSERAMRWMCRQYGSTLLELEAELGSWEAVGSAIGAGVQAARILKSHG